MISRKFFSGIVVAGVLLAMLSACASKQQAVSEQQQPSAAEEAKKAAAKAEQEKAIQEAEIARQKAAEQEKALKEAEIARQKAAAGLGPDGKPLKGEAEPPVVPPKAGAGAVAAEGNLKRVHFEFDKYNITPEAADILKVNRDYMMSHPNVRVLIEGHCDERGTVDYNLALGERRANSVRRFLQDLRIDGKRMDIISYGEERPLDPAANEDAWAKNRRADFREL